jgi:glutathione S-transferase
MSADAKAAAPKKAKLYYTPTSCGAVSFITAVTNGLKIDTEIVDLATHKTASGADFYAINPKGNVPALVLADGTVLNENVAVLSYLADQNISAFPSTLQSQMVLVRK